MPTSVISDMVRTYMDQLMHYVYDRETMEYLTQIRETFKSEERKTAPEIDPEELLKAVDKLSDG